MTLYDNGTIGSVTLQKTSNAKITYDADCIKIASAVNTKINAIYFSVDFTNYRTLYIKAVGYSNSAQWSCGYSQSVPDENITSSIYRTNINANSGDIAIDISALKGIYYPFITGYKNQSGVEQPSCLYKMYLEP